MSGSRLPSRAEYDDALADPPWAFRSAVLQEAEFIPKPSARAGFIHASGNFTVVARARFEGKEWAVRLPVMDIGSTIDHYGALPSLLGRIQPFAREVRVFDAEIRVSDDSDDRFPVVATEWFDGDQLSEFVRKCCANDDRDALVALRRSLHRLSATLHQVGVSHGDVTGENILVGSGLDNELTVKLIDYDSMWSSDEPFASRLSPVGVNELQHPRQGNPIGPHADKVAFMLIDVALGLLAMEPSIGTNDDLFDGRRFVFTATEVLNHASPLLERIPERDRPVVEALRGYLASDPQLPPRAWWDEQEPVGESIRSIAKAGGAPISFVASAAHAVLDRRFGHDEPLSDDQAVALRSQIARWRAQFNEAQLVIQCGEVDSDELVVALRESGISRKRLARGELTPAEFTELVGLIRRVPALNGVEETVRGIADRLAVRESFVLAAFKAARGRSVGPDQAITLDEVNGTTGVVKTWMRQHTEHHLNQSLGITPPLKEILHALRALEIPYSELQDGALTPDEFMRIRQQIQAAHWSPPLTRSTHGFADEIGFRRSVVVAAWGDAELTEDGEKRLRRQLAIWASKHNRSCLERDLGLRGTPSELESMLSSIGVGLKDLELGRMTPAEFARIKEWYATLSPSDAVSQSDAVSLSACLAVIVPVAAALRGLGAWGLATGVVLGPLALKRLSTTKKRGRPIAIGGTILGILGAVLAVLQLASGVRDAVSREERPPARSTIPQRPVASATSAPSQEPLVPPIAPSVVDYSIDGSFVRLWWDAGSDGVEYWDVSYRVAPAGGAFSEWIQRTGLTEPSLSFKPSVPAGEAIDVEVIIAAGNSAGLGPPLGAQLQVPLPEGVLGGDSTTTSTSSTVPDEPLLAPILEVSSGRNPIELRWNPGTVDPDVMYEVLIRSDVDRTWRTLEITDELMSFIQVGANEKARWFEFRVVATRDGEGPQASARVRVANPVPAAAATTTTVRPSTTTSTTSTTVPQLRQPVLQGWTVGSRVELDWDDQWGVSGVSYEVSYRSDVVTSWRSLGSVSSSRDSISISSGLRDSWFEFRVAASARGQALVYSNVVRVANPVPATTTTTSTTSSSTTTSSTTTSTSSTTTSTIPTTTTSSSSVTVVSEVLSRSSMLLQGDISQNGVFWTIRLRDPVGARLSTAPVGARLCPVASSWPDGTGCTGATAVGSGSSVDRTYTFLFLVAPDAPLGPWIPRMFGPVSGQPDVVGSARVSVGR